MDSIKFADISKTGDDSNVTMPQEQLKFFSIIGNKSSQPDYKSIVGPFDHEDAEFDFDNLGKNSQSS